ncbi:MAG TPA: M48 family metalloprotease [Pirellulales bacterium]
MPTDPGSAIESARELLPAWCAWGAIVIWPALATVTSSLAAGLGAIIGGIPVWRLRQDAPWTERARASYPVRAVVGTSTIVVPMLLGMFAGMFWGRIWLVSRGALVILTALAAFVPAWLISVALARRIFGREFITRRRAVGQLAFLYLLSVPHLILALLLAAVLPTQMTPTAVIMICLCVAAILCCLLGGGAALARRLGLLRSVSPDVAATVARAGEKAGIVPRGVYRLDCAMSNAFALWASGEIAFSDMLLGETNAAELEAITMHELAHLTESRASRIARLAACLCIVPLAAAAPIIGSYGVEAYLAAVAFVFVGSLLIQRLARRMEERADRQSHAQQSDDGIYAKALEKLYRTNLSPAVLRGNRHVHPHLYDRMLAAGVAPLYDRPAPPSARWRMAALAATFLPIVAVLWTWSELPDVAAAHGDEGRFLSAALAARGDDQWAAWILSRLAANCTKRGDIEPAIRYLQASTELNEQSLFYPARLAIVLVKARRCTDAEQALSIALDRLKSRKSSTARRIDEQVIQQARAAVRNCAD